MGSLVRIPASEWMATLEVLERLGITPAQLQRLRSDSGYQQKILAGFLEQPFIQPDFPSKYNQLTLLSRVGTFTDLPSLGKFVVRDHFQVDTSDKARVRISYLGEGFKDWCWDVVEERAYAESIICFYTLLQSSLDCPIITELGGKERVLTTFLTLYRLLLKQRIGQPGILLTNGQSNIFYIPDNTGELRVIAAHLSSFGWVLHTPSVSRLGGQWRDGTYVFSRNS